MSEPEMHNCYECGKEIPDEEWVVNWGSCSECFDKHYQEYLDSHPEPVDIEVIGDENDVQ